ncbi:MAG TPA: hypothetical protein VFY20_06940 [Gemmatimonadales bacterium]|nr:hypothetical protein [Gemmatimonadales bacterium]
MVSLGALVLPIVLSAVLVFALSSLIHMVLGYHASDYTKLPDEDGVRAAIRRANPTTRQYVIPYAGSMGEMKSAEYQQKIVEGPVAVLTIKPSGEVGMGKALGIWFVYALVVSALVAYVASSTLPRGTGYLKVFQVVGTTAWLAYSFGQLPASIWMGKPWSIAAKEVFDGLLYGLFTGGVFGWLWPR